MKNIRAGMPLYLLFAQHYACRQINTAEIIIDNPCILIRIAPVTINVLRAIANSHTPGVIGFINADIIPKRIGRAFICNIVN